MDFCGFFLKNTPVFLCLCYNKNMSAVWRPFFWGVIAKHASWIIPALIISLIFTNQVVFADSPSLSVSITPDSAEMSLLIGEFGSTDQTITVFSTNTTGYSVKLATTGPSSALINQSDSSKSIPTFTLPSGSSSIPVSSLGDGYGYSIDNGSNYYPVPEPAGPNALLFSTDSAGTNEHKLTFGVKVPISATVGVYSNTFDIIVLPNFEECPANSICYEGNGDDGTGTMANQSVSSNSKVTLLASNFSRSGYGFAGWNTESDGSGTNYGPNQAVDVGDLSSAGLRLYARWIASAGNLQGWAGCSALVAGQVTALTDTRDGSTYAVAKLADNQCWMVENLRLDLSDTNLEINGLNTNSPTPAFVTAINSHPASTNTFCTSINSACIDQVLYNSNNTNRDLTASYDANNTSSSWYSYGNYYNWYAITAGNGTYSMSTGGVAVVGDICPAGWRLPTGYGNIGDLVKLDIAMGGSGVNYAENSTAGLAAMNRWRTYPNNFIYGGEQKGNTAANRFVSSSYASSSVVNNERTANLWLKQNGVSMNSNSTQKVRGQTVRCIANREYSETGNIHYDANGGTGLMADATDVDLGAAVAATNQFIKAHSDFVSWNTSADGTGVMVAEGGSVAAAANHMGITSGGTLTLYAIWRSHFSLAYDGNGADAGSMSSVRVSDLTAGTLALVASNFSRAGYGFAGWSLDASASSKISNGESVDVYGPNETITVDSAFLDHADATTSQITLYAVWLPENNNYTMQSFRTAQCSAMSIGDTIALKDVRDNNVYTVTKLKDNHCWMTENLRLDLNGITFDDSNTNLPAEGFVSVASSSSSNTTLCNVNTTACVDSIRFNTNNINRSLTASHSSNNNGSSWYSYGVMYSWYTATAGNGNLAMTSGDVTGDICPAGWRLPTGGNSGEFTALNTAQNGGSSGTDAGLVKFPANFNYSGDYNNNKAGGRGSYGRYWSATPNGNNNTYRLGVTSSGPTPAGSYNKWDAFAIRCIVK